MVPAWRLTEGPSSDKISLDVGLLWETPVIAIKVHTNRRAREHSHLHSLHGLQIQKYNYHSAYSLAVNESLPISRAYSKAFPIQKPNSSQCYIPAPDHASQSTLIRK
jgi:hypothetical protein